jgi:hypothetical protein
MSIGGLFLVVKEYFDRSIVHRKAEAGDAVG